ncbi:MAG TPA: indolepyruvate oxidoreductase subunit beta family protein [Candidatus Angelobacter sp.]|nr:indolepyruvate oxidoreductase subunit beta family protein [Candidatus Angelobacter sp.]
MATTLSHPETAPAYTAPRAITIAILAMGGEGGGVLADWIVDLAENSGYLAQTTSVPGVAQRTGSTIYYVELFPADAAAKAGKDPVLALMPVPGEVDIVIASELMEAGRAITRGLVTPDRTTFIASTNRVYSMTEKIAMGDGRVDAESFVRAGKAAASKFIYQDFSRIAEESRSVISATLFGALAGSGRLPFHRGQFELAIRSSGISVESSLKAFNAGLEAATQAETSPAAAPQAESLSAPAPGRALQSLAAEISRNFPAASHAVLLAAIQRLADYQDVAYASEFLKKLEPILLLETQRQKTSGDNDSRVLTETARYLALWMSYEDAIRVADLKIRRTRFDRVQSDVRMKPGQLLQIREFLHPRVEEFADIMPAGLGAWMLRTQWTRNLINRLNRKGKVLQTTSLSGFLQLYLVAGLRRWRKGSLRFRRETARMDRWLAIIRELIPADYAFAAEVAESPRLVKGYGDTYALGSRNFDLLMGAVPELRKRENPATALKRLRDAAWSDDTGKALDDAILEFKP